MKTKLMKRVSLRFHELKNNILDLLFVPFWNR